MRFIQFILLIQLFFIFAIIPSSSNAFTSSSNQPAFAFDTLRNMRQKIIFPKYTNQQKITLVKQMQVMFDVTTLLCSALLFSFIHPSIYSSIHLLITIIHPSFHMLIHSSICLSLLTFKNEITISSQQTYVSRDSKILNYGSRIDPLPKLSRILGNVTRMTEIRLHTELTSLFLSLRDWHTNYYLPKPHACYHALWPLEFSFIASENFEASPNVVVKAFTSLKEAMRFSHDIRKLVEIGDKLITYNGLTFKEFYNLNKAKTGGANLYGGMRSVVGFLSYRPGSMFMMPNETEAVYVLEKRNGKQYTVKAPIVARENRECLRQYTHPNESPNYKVFTSKKDEEWTQKRLAMFEKNENAYHPFLEDMKRSFDQNLDFKFHKTKDDILSWSIYKKGESNVGIIRLDSFVPSSNNVDLVLELFHGLLVRELRDTEALIIDVRSNGGGIISLADSIPQFFVADYIPPGARVLVSPTNALIFNSSEFAQPDSLYFRAIFYS